MESESIALGLTAVILAVTDEVPRVLVVRRMSHTLATPAQRGSRTSVANSPDSPDSLPNGPFDPARHRTLELGLTHWVEDQTGLDLRYVEQLYTFGNQYRDIRELQGGPRLISVAYVALTHESLVAGSGEAQWRDCYSFLPWEDWRDGRPGLIDRVIGPALRQWVAEAETQAVQRARQARVDVCFGRAPDAAYDRERCLDRYELLYEAGLVPEARRDRMERHGSEALMQDDRDLDRAKMADLLGPPMALDNRRILAAALGRIRGKLAYRPLVFELLPNAFTLFQLQRVVEALAGTRLHKQNFRRMVMAAELVEPTGRMDTSSRGRPAELYRFRREAVRERSMAGIGLPGIRVAE